VLDNKSAYYLIRIFCNVVETDETGDEFAVEEVVGVIDSSQTPVSVVV